MEVEQNAGKKRLITLHSRRAPMIHRAAAQQRVQDQDLVSVHVI
jgi:hypothetical protein